MCLVHMLESPKESSNRIIDRYDHCSVMIKKTQSILYCGMFIMYNLIIRMQLNSNLKFFSRVLPCDTL